MTLLETIWTTEGTETEVIATVTEALKTGELTLTGNFKGHEAEIVAEAA